MRLLATIMAGKRVLLKYLGFSIMTAQQAKESTQYLCSNRNKRSLKSILAEIQGAIAGNIYSPPSFGVRIPGGIDAEVESELKELGYEVEYREQFKGIGYTHISWA